MKGAADNAILLFFEEDGQMNGFVVFESVGARRRADSDNGRLDELCLVDQRQLWTIVLSAGHRIYLGDLGSRMVSQGNAPWEGYDKAEASISAAMKRLGFSGKS